ncbi:HAD family hydrolase [Sphingobium phenoxybenzoativorans]|uniref:HAD family hydrolase n=1 Tax=Sphingobium phenoxybenzoativorans TaxID=1592790 RepID=UPI0009F16E1F|nr:HAD-IB family phosphatase [Sphingobium phenoxybenzoativorans]
MTNAQRLDADIPGPSVDVARAAPDARPAIQIVPRAIPVPISIFDLDRTLTRHGTYTPFLIYAALRIAPWRIALLPLMLFGMIAYKLGFVSRCQLKALQHGLLIGRSLPRRRIDSLARGFADRLWRKGILKKGVLRIAQERAEGRRVMLATAANSYYLQAIADRIGISEVISTRSVWHGDILRPTIDGDNCYGAAKRSMTMAYLEDAGLDRSDLHLRFFSDHVSDRPTFEWVDEPIAVNPSPKLMKLARQKGWEVLDWT